jgi:spore coat protein CotF
MSAWHASCAICGQDYKLPAVSTVLRAKTMQSKQLKAACLHSMMADDGYYDPKNYLHDVVILIM